MNWLKDVFIEENDNDNYSCQVEYESSNSIAMVYGKTAKECEFNCELIASAPKMLKLLKDYINYGDSRIVRDEAISLINNIGKNPFAIEPVSTK